MKAVLFEGFGSKSPIDKKKPSRDRVKKLLDKKRKKKLMKLTPKI